MMTAEMFEAVDLGLQMAIKANRSIGWIAACEKSRETLAELRQEHERLERESRLANVSISNIAAELLKSQTALAAERERVARLVRLIGEADAYCEAIEEGRLATPQAEKEEL